MYNCAEKLQLYVYMYCMNMYVQWYNCYYLLYDRYFCYFKYCNFQSTEVVDILRIYNIGCIKLTFSFLSFIITCIIHVIVTYNISKVYIKSIY